MKFNPSASRSPAPPRHQAGLTLIELLVALALGVLITLAAAGALVVARQGFTAVDSAAQLRENARFSSELIQRIGVQAGYENVVLEGPRERDTSATPPGELPGVEGFDNSWVTTAGLPGSLANGNRPTSPCGAADTSCLNGSDVLVVRFKGAGERPNGDGTIIDCSGRPAPYLEADGTSPRRTSIFHVTRSAEGEPALSCTFQSGGAWTTVELVKGVEGLQILYGVDAVPTSRNSPQNYSCLDGVPDRYLTAAQMVGPSADATQRNWGRVRSLRIGMLFRGDVGSAQVREVANWDLLGADAVSGTDVGSRLTTAADGRLRHQYIFTIHLRNPQGFQPCFPTPDLPCPLNAAC